MSFELIGLLAFAFCSGMTAMVLYFRRAQKKLDDLTRLWHKIDRKDADRYRHIRAGTGGVRAVAFDEGGYLATSKELDTLIDSDMERHSIIWPTTVPE